MQETGNILERSIRRGRPHVAAIALRSAVVMILSVGLWLPAELAGAQTPGDSAADMSSPADSLRLSPDSWTSPERLNSTLQVVLLMSVVSLAPAILLMTTSFVRIAVVLGLL